MKPRTFFMSASVLLLFLGGCAQPLTPKDKLYLVTTRNLAQSAKEQAELADLKTARAIKEAEEASERAAVAAEAAVSAWKKVKEMTPPGT